MSVLLVLFDTEKMTVSLGILLMGRNAVRNHSIASDQTYDPPAKSGRILHRETRLVCDILPQDASFSKLDFRCQEILFIRDMTEFKCGSAISINGFPRVFEWPRSRVYAIFKQGVGLPGHPRSRTMPAKGPCDEKKDQGSLYNEISNFSGSNMREFVSFSASG
jgi:hypothetical protein